MENVRIIDFNNVNDEDVTFYLDKIKDNNGFLYNLIINCLNNTKSLGLRFDCLEFFSKEASLIGSLSGVPEIVSSLIGNHNVSSEHFSWICDYFRENSEVKASEFVVIFQSALEKGMSLEDIKNIFSESSSSLEIFEKVDSFESEVPEKTELAICDDNTSITESSDDSVMSIFGNLMTVISEETHLGEKDLLATREKFNYHVTQLELCLNEILHEWEAGKHQISRYAALYNIQQNMLNTLQQNLNASRREIDDLKRQLLEAEKVKIAAENIKAKAKELEGLALAADLNN